MGPPVLRHRPQHSKDPLRSQNDYEVNLKAELDIQAS